ncbi:hypothetical protein D1839_11610 [Roseburia sp. 1XD42-34]|nr:hypothetical protein [Roseburia sp. 1XD42-34]RKI77070.1 hypothetical protein D7V87_11595 [Clostridium sp. 1xD42-85]
MRESIFRKRCDFADLDPLYFFEQALVVKGMLKKGQIKSTIMGGKLYSAFAYLPIIEQTELCFEHALIKDRKYNYCYVFIVPYRK